LPVHTVGGQSLDSTSRSERAGVGNTHDCDQDHSVEDRWQNLDTGKLNGDDERRVSRGRTIAAVQLAVRRHNQSDEEEVDDVEDEDTQGDLFRGPRDLLLGVLGLSGGQTDQLGSSVGESSGDEHSTEAVEAVEEGGVGVFPIAVCQSCSEPPLVCT
jgi:hypothetical protein